MSLSDCEKCDLTPCRCGYEYETWRTEEIQALHDILGELLARRAKGEHVRLPEGFVYAYDQLTRTTPFVFQENKAYTGRFISATEILIDDCGKEDK